MARDTSHDVVFASAFEAMDKMIGDDPAFRAEYATVTGVDLEKVKSPFPRTTWEKGLPLAAKKLFPDIPVALQSSYSQICLRFGISLDTPTCDAAAAKKKGDDYLGNGMDTAALAKYEESLRCKYDSTLVKTAYLAACRSKQVAKARLYFSKLPPDASANYQQLCLRFGIDPSASSSSAVENTGTLRLQSKPRAEVFLDGKAIGTTPVTTTATAGKHKVTYVIDANKYTFAVTVKANEVTNLVKDLSVD